MFSGGGHDCFSHFLFNSINECDENVLSASFFLKKSRNQSMFLSSNKCSNYVQKSQNRSGKRKKISIHDFHYLFLKNI